MRPAAAPCYRLLRLLTVALGAGILVSLTATPAAAVVGNKALIGIVMPSAPLDHGADVSESLRQGMLARLHGSGVDAVLLDASAQGPAEAEARTRGCTLVLYTRVQKKGGGLLGKLSLAGALPFGKGGAAPSQPAGTSLSSVAKTSIKSGDVIQLDYRLMPVGAAAALQTDTFQSKADTDGQDLFSPMVEQLAGAVSGAAQNGNTVAATAGGAAASGANPTAPPAEAPAGHGSVLGGLFGHHAASGAKSTPPAAQDIDCAKMAAMPGSVFTRESCEQMKGAQASYQQALNDPSASRPGDEQMSCDQIMAEFRQQQITAPDKAKAAEAQATAAKEQAMLKHDTTTLLAHAAEDQAVVEAAAMTDRATELATMGLVDPNTAGKAAQAMQKKEVAEGREMAKARQPTEVKMNSQTADFGTGAASQLTANPRMARLNQLANSHHCKGG